MPQIQKRICQKKNHERSTGGIFGIGLSEYIHAPDCPEIGNDGPATSIGILKTRPLCLAPLWIPF